MTRLGAVQRRAVGDAATGRLGETQELPTAAWNIAELSPDGRWLLQDQFMRGLVVYDLRTGKQEHELPLEEGEALHQAVFSPDGKRVAVLVFPGGSGGGPGGAGQKARVRVWDRSTGKAVFATDLGKLRGKPGSLAFTHDGRVLSPEDTPRAIDLATGRPVLEAGLPHREEDDQLRTSPDGKVLFVARASGVLEGLLTQTEHFCYQRPRSAARK